MSPSGLRTATAQFEGPRIITPSRTACPPTVVIASYACIAQFSASVGDFRRTHEQARTSCTRHRKRCLGGLSTDRGHEEVPLAAARAAGFLEPALEAFDSSTRVDQLLLARVERVAVRADLDVELGLRRPRLEGVPAGARHGREDVVGMDVRLHSKPG